MFININVYFIKYNIWIESLKNKFINYLDELKYNLDYLQNHIYEEIEQTINLIKNSFNSGGKIIFFGNGGSASDSQHLCAEFVGRYKKIVLLCLLYL